MKKFYFIAILFLGSGLIASASMLSDMFYQPQQIPFQQFGATILYPSGGGTGTSTNPSYGQMLMGTSGGVFQLTATSSLGITAGWDSLDDISLTKGYFIVGNDSNIAQATSSIFISSTGLVGIGTTSPARALHVEGTGRVDDDFTIYRTGSSELGLYADTLEAYIYADPNLTIYSVGYTHFDGSDGLYHYLPGAGNYYGILDFGSIATSDKTFTFPNKSLTFAGINNETFTGLTTFSNATGTQLTTTGSTYLATLGGYVGIGTTSPDSLTHIVGSTAGSSGSGAGSILHLKQNTAWSGAQPWALFVEGYSSLGDLRLNAADGQRSLYSSYYEMGFGTNAKDISFSTDGSGATRKVVIQATTGNVGIGTTTPTSKLTITSGGSGTTAIATTTFTIGEIGTTTSRACFNTKNTAGADISFYFNVSNVMVVEANLCK